MTSVLQEPLPVDRPRKLPGRAPARWELNVRLLAVTALVLLVAVPGIWYWHSRQVHANADGLLARAIDLEHQNKRAAAGVMLKRYLRLRPHDVKQRIHLADLYGHAAATRDEKQQSLKLYAVAQGLSNENPQLKTRLRRRRMELLLELGYLQQAHRQARAFLDEADRSRDPLALRVQALALYHLDQSGAHVQPGHLREALVDAARQNPDNVELVQVMSGWLRTQWAGLPGNSSLRTEYVNEADAAMDRLVDASSNRALALVARHRYRLDHDPKGSDSDLSAALRLDNDRHISEVRVAAGQHALANQQCSRAVEFFSQAIEAPPAGDRPLEVINQAYLGLGQAHLGLEQTGKAIDAWQTGLRVGDPSSIELNFELAQQFVILGQLDQAGLHLDRLEDEVVARAEFLMPRQLARLDEPVRALRAEWFFAARQYATAADLLASIINVPSPADDAARRQRQRLHLRLGTCHALLKQWEHAARAFEQAADADPSSAEARLAAADAHERAGNLKSAIDGYRAVLELPGPPPTVWASLAHAHFRRQLEAPAAQREWAQFEIAMTTARQLLPDDPNVLILAARYAAITNQTNQAAALLVQAGSASAIPDRVREQLVLTWQQIGRPREAQEALDAWQRAAGRSVRISLLRARLLSLEQRNDQARRLLQSTLLATPQSQRGDVEFQLALLDIDTGKNAQAAGRLARLARQSPGELRFAQLLAELALDNRDTAQLADSVRQLRGIEGQEGTLWRFFEAHRLALLAQGPNDKRLSQAESLQAEIQRLRPSWSAGYLLKGRLARQRNQFDDAITAYQTAIDMGESRQPVFEHLVQLLYRQNRFEEADEALSRLADHRDVSPRLAELSIATSIQLNDLNRAITAARRQVKADPDNALHRIWLAQALEANRELAEAEEHLVKATRLAGQDPRPWSALLRYYVRSERPGEARRTLEAMEQQVKVSDQQRPFVLAQAYEIAGDDRRAGELYRQAIKSSPDEPVVWQRASAFFFQSDVRQAEKCLRRVIALRPDSGLARRMLATLLAAPGPRRDLDQAIALLDYSGLSPNDQAANERLKVRLLLAAGGADSRRAAHNALDSLVRGSDQPQAADRLLLARFNEVRDRPSAARQQYSLAIAQDQSPAVLSAYADFLLREGLTDEAARWLDQLEAKAPAGQHLTTLSLRARWLEANQRQAEIEPLVESFIEQLSKDIDDARRARVLSQAAVLYASMHLPDQADRTFRKAAALDSIGAHAWALSLADAGQAVQAVEIAAGTVRSDPSPESAVVLANVLSRCHAANIDKAAADSLLEESLLHHPRHVPLLVAAGTFRLLEDRGEEAASLFRRALEIDGDHVVALNNLAMVLAGQPALRTEAIEHLDRAMALSGRNAELLDSKGWILLLEDELRQAEQLFREAVELAPLDARPRLHLAIACWRQGRTREARDWLQQARRQELAVDLLSPTERAHLTRLEDNLRS